MAFPQTPLVVYTELQVGSAWSDVSADPYLRNKITISGGRQDEGSRVDPASCAVLINNRSNKYSPRNPLSPLYGQIGRNTPLRVSVAAGSCFLRATDDTEPDARVSTPTATALNITGDMDIRFDIEPDDWEGAGYLELAGKLGGAGQNAWYLILDTGTLHLGWTTDGTNVTEAFTGVQEAVHRRRMCVRATIDVDNGNGGRTVQFFTGPTMAGPWTQLGVDQTFSGTTATATSTAPLEIGDLTRISSQPNVGGRIYAAEIRSGINGTVVANPTFTAQTAGALSFTDGSGRTWTATSASVISNRRPRHVGEVSAWPQRWDADGKDVYVPMQSAGIMRRLGQGATPLDSALRRTLIAAQPLAYWPLEDGSDARRAASGLLGGAAMNATVAPPAFSSIEGPAGSLSLPDFSSGGMLAAPVPPGTATEWTIECVMLFPTSFTSGSTTPLGWTTAGTTTTWQVIITPGPTGGVSYQWANATASSVHDGSFSGNVTDGRWHHIRINAAQSGTSINTQLWLDGVMLFSDFDATQTLGVIQTVAINPLQATDSKMPSVGHLAIWSPQTGLPTYDAVSGFSGEWTDTRLFRLAEEESIPLIAPYGFAGDTPLGPQRSDTLLNVLQDAVDPNVGILYEPRHMVALAARSKDSLYNQPVALALNYAADGEVPPPLEPTEDDQSTRNDVTRSRPNGSSERVTLDVGPLSTKAPPNGIGRVPDSQPVNVEGDDQLADIASWWLHLGTVDEARYPQVTVDLSAAPWLIDQATAVEVGDRISISNLPPWVAPGGVDLQVQGYTETIGVYDWTITFNCVPASPWTVGVADDPVLGKASSDGSTLAAGVTSTAGTLSIATPSGPLWTPDPAEYPFNLLVGGEVVTARAAGAPIDLVDGTFESGVTGWTPTGGTFAPSTDAHTGTGSGVLTVSGSPTQAFVRPDNAHQPAATPGVEYRYSVWVKSSTSWTAMAAVDWLNSSHTLLSTASGTSVGLTAGVWTLLTVTGTAPASTAFARSGPTLTVSPPNGTTLTVDDSVTVPTSTYLASPQSMAVTRSVNGVVKAQASGAAVELATPLILAL